MTQEMEIVYRTKTYVIIRIGKRHYRIWRSINGVDIVNNEGEQLDVRWLL